MPIRVEFYGLARQRAGVAETAVSAPVGQLSLADVLRDLSGRFPGLAGERFGEGCLPPELTVNIDGQRFVRDPTVRIFDGQSLLIMSSDAGG